MLLNHGSEPRAAVRVLTCVLWQREAKLHSSSAEHGLAGSELCWAGVVFPVWCQPPQVRMSSPGLRLFTSKQSYG